MNIPTNLVSILKELEPTETVLVAVSKTRTIDEILEAYNAGQRVFGENKVQEMVSKHDGLPKDIQWHLVGHLQTNKVKFIAHFINFIHSVDSFKLLNEINKEAMKNNRVIDCLLQIHIAKEETKFGLSYEEARELLSTDELNSLMNIKIVGLMGMATLTEDITTIKNEFHSLKKFYDSLSNEMKFTTLSMGMSSDYKVAIVEGSNMVRIGSSIFGERHYI